MEKKRITRKKKKVFPAKTAVTTGEGEHSHPPTFFTFEARNQFSGAHSTYMRFYFFFSSFPPCFLFASKAGEMVPRAQYIFEVSYENSSKETKNNGISFVILHLSPSTPPLLAILRKTLQLPATFHTLNTSFTL